MIGRGVLAEHTNLQVLKHDIEHHASRCRVPRKTKKNSKIIMSLPMARETLSNAMYEIEAARRKIVGGHSPGIIGEIVNSLLCRLNLLHFLQRQLCVGTVRKASLPAHIHQPPQRPLSAPNIPVSLPPAYMDSLHLPFLRYSKKSMEQRLIRTFLLSLLSLEIEMVLLPLRLLLLQLPAVSFVSNIAPDILIINEETEAPLAHKNWCHPMMSYGGTDQYTTISNLVYGAFSYTRSFGFLEFSSWDYFSNFSSSLNLSSTTLLLC
jgi:hypothetical protein